MIDAPNVMVARRSTPLSDVPTMTKGCQPTDGGNLIIEDKERDAFISAEPQAEKYIKRLMGAKEFINNNKRWCLWLVGVSPAELRKMPMIRERVEKVREFRLKSSFAGTRKLADSPTTFRETYNPEHYIAVPEVSSERRRYIPIGFMDSTVIPTNKIQIIPDATLYHFGILNSNVHMSWMRVVCGRLKSDYDYSIKIVYNNFPWPVPDAKQRESIEKTAKAIIDARAIYPDSSLADLYDPNFMPPELLKAHRANDKAVMQAYGFWGKLNSESECVAELMRMYEELTNKEK